MNTKSLPSLRDGNLKNRKDSNDFYSLKTIYFQNYAYPKQEIIGEKKVRESRAPRVRSNPKSRVDSISHLDREMQPTIPNPQRFLEKISGMTTKLPDFYESKRLISLRKKEAFTHKLREGLSKLTTQAWVSPYKQRRLEKLQPIEVSIDQTATNTRTIVVKGDHA
eukprot:TRINITY_DN18218_c0_g1_i1.p1 TRINITY_DN18218_c0_g1~~TRINITY_DN18218_c0_g1_i1.p1  ORF type:complete len:165 (+),score=19.92 TRINITY_DN18218_c0_g1_i1:148-642(+)